MAGLNCAAAPKNFLKGEYQLLFEFVNIVAFAVDFFLMEALSKLDAINLHV